MKYLQYTQYIYLVAAVLFALKTAEIWDQDNDQHFLFLGITLLSVFMFFFRRRFSKKFEDRNNKS
ncbi:LPXTG cell wall anchor domain-containing protein [uncultured Flavobacterium sp.]|jgi:LPXTG-motif cell wall-anchored protein|uniref:LPXTG cell wall anchor domain-containing protein n=1 Tax=uncultured Flavobacterium sp. TaxID=165435 RepID=UPI0030CA3B81